METELKDVIKMITNRFWLILLIVVGLTSLVAVYTYLIAEPVYEATTKIIVNKTRSIDGQREININDVETNLRIIKTYKELLKTEWMMQDVLVQHPEFNLTVKELLKKIKVIESADSQVMTFSVTDRSYPNAAAIVNAITQQFGKKIPELIEVNNITILNEADVNDKPNPVSPNRLFNMIIAIGLSLIIGVGLAILLDYFDDTIHTEQDINRIFDTPMLGMIMKMKRSEYKSGGAKMQQTQEGEKAYVTTN